MQIRPNEVVQCNIMESLMHVPKKSREKYGPRKNLTVEERLELGRQRNREHARATRLRKKIFKKVNKICPFFKVIVHVFMCLCVYVVMCSCDV